MRGRFSHWEIGLAQQAHSSFRNHDTEPLDRLSVEFEFPILAPISRLSQQRLGDWSVSAPTKGPSAVGVRRSHPTQARSPLAAVL